MRPILFLTFILLWALVVEARDLEASLKGVSETIRMLGIVMGSLSFLISGICFYFSRRLGLERLQSAAMGTLVFALSSTIFSLIFNSFN